MFAYFCGPDEVPLEYAAEVLQIDDSYELRGSDYWKYAPGRSEQWGITAAALGALLPRAAAIRLYGGWRSRELNPGEWAYFAKIGATGSSAGACHRAGHFGPDPLADDDCVGNLWITGTSRPVASRPAMTPYIPAAHWRYA